MVAFAIVFIGFMIIVGGLYFITMNVAYNELITVMNTFISAGDVSKQFITYWNFTIGLAIALPLLFMVALAIWGYVRAIERRQEGGG